MSTSATTRVAVTASDPRARIEIVGGAVVPRIVSRTSTAARVALVAGGALLLPGDTVRIDIAVAAGATLDLEDVGGTVCYGERDPARSPAAWAHWEVRIHVADGAVLRWDGLPLVIADGARVRRRTSVILAAGATALLREISVLGRSGERGGELRARFDAADSTGPLLVEDLSVVGSRPEVGVLGPHRVYDTVSALGYRPPPRGAACEVLDLDGPGAVARYLGEHTHNSAMARVFDAWRAGAVPD